MTVTGRVAVVVEMLMVVESVKPALSDTFDKKHSFKIHHAILKGHSKFPTHKTLPLLALFGSLTNHLYETNCSHFQKEKLRQAFKMTQS